MYSSTGVYTLSKAARIINVPSRTIHRWLYGNFYTRKSDEGVVREHSRPLWTPQVSKEDFDVEVIGFNDLLEVRFVAAFVAHGVPLIVVRKCLENAKAILGVQYPMTSGAFKTDGRTIFSDSLAQAEREGELLDLKNRQLAFKEIISSSLYAGIEYSGELAAKWYPQEHEKQNQIVLDPSRQFGSPILEETGVPTDILFASYKAEGGTEEAIKRTARSYDTASKLVEAAVRYENSLLRRVH